MPHSSSSSVVNVENSHHGATYPVGHLPENTGRHGRFERRQECRAAAPPASTCRRQAGRRRFVPVTTVSISRLPPSHHINLVPVDNAGVRDPYYLACLP